MAKNLDLMLVGVGNKCGSAYHWGCVVKYNYKICYSFLPKDSM